MIPVHEASWADRCLRFSPGSFEPGTLEDAMAAAAMALDGALLPTARSGSELVVALAALASQRDAGPLFDRALQPAIGAGSRVVLWGAIALRSRDSQRSQQWAAAISDAEAQHELLAHDARVFAELGDFEGARARIAALPATWMLRTDNSSWPMPPPWIGGAGAAAAVAFASPHVASAPRGKALLEEAERRASELTEDWRRNREWRAIALAWGRAGDLERALTAASRMPGTERSRAIAELLDLFGDAPGVDVARLSEVALRAAAVRGGEPLIVGAAPDDPLSAQARGALRSLVGDATAGEVLAALARRYVARGDLESARSAVDSIPEHVAVHGEADLQVGAAELARGQVTLEELVDVEPNDAMIPNLVGAAVAVGLLDAVPLLLGKAQFGGRLAANVLRSAIEQERFDHASALLGLVWSLLTPADAGDIIFHLVRGLARVGRLADALRSWRYTPRMQFELPERTVLIAGYRLVVELVAAGHHADAYELRGNLQARQGGR